MNTKINPRRSCLTLTVSLGLAALLLAACSDRQRSDLSTDTKQAMDKATTAMSDAWDDVKTYTFDKKDDFVASTKAMTSKLDAEVSKLRANYAEEKASASRKAAMEELKNSRADLDSKLSALGRASADTWEHSKREVIAAWDRVQAAYHKAKAD